MVRLRKGLFIFVDLLADVLSELLKDFVLSTRRVHWKQRTDQHGEEGSCRYQVGVRPLDYQRMIDRVAGGWAKRHGESISWEATDPSSRLTE